MSSRSDCRPSRNRDNVARWTPVAFEIPSRLGASWIAFLRAAVNVIRCFGLGMLELSHINSGLSSGITNSHRPPAVALQLHGRAAEQPRRDPIVEDSGNPPGREVGDHDQGPALPGIQRGQHDLVLVIGRPLPCAHLVQHSQVALAPQVPDSRGGHAVAHRVAQASALRGGHLVAEPAVRTVYAPEMIQGGEARAGLPRPRRPMQDQGPRPLTNRQLVDDPPETGVNECPAPDRLRRQLAPGRLSRLDCQS